MNGPGRRSPSRRVTAFVGGKIAALDRRVLILGGFTYKGSELYTAQLPSSLYIPSTSVVPIVMQREVLRLTVPALPTVATLLPASGPINLEASLTITGTGFSAAGIAVTVLNTATQVSSSLTSIVVVNDTKITAKIAANTLTAVGATTVTVSNTNGSVAYAYAGTASMPFITSVTPNTCATGATLTLTFAGVGFTGATAATLRDATHGGFDIGLSSFFVNSDIECIADYSGESSDPQTTYVTVTGLNGVSNQKTFTLT